MGPQIEKFLIALICCSVTANAISAPARSHNLPANRRVFIIVLENKN
jgi:hypothetical protein